MFSTLLGALPGSPADEAGSVRAAVEAQAAAGLELISDGRAAVDVLSSDDAVARWQRASELTELPLKARLLGPFTALRRAGQDAGGLDVVTRLRAEIDALAAAGCPFVEIEEPDAIATADDPIAAAELRALHLDVAADAPVHLCLVLSGGNVDRAGSATFVDPPYASYAVDLIAGPDNWRLVADVPADRGVVCGALAARPGSDDSPELLVWAAHYAASTGGRGLERVGLANQPGLDALAWEVAAAKLARLADAARIAGLPRTGELAAALDPRATDLKSRALGRRAGRDRGG